MDELDHSVNHPLSHPLEHYLRLHLTGAAGGIELFARGDRLHERAAREAILAIRHELRDERIQLLDIASTLGVRPPSLACLAAQVAEKAARLKPNGMPLRRTRLDDLIDLETMRIAVAGKLAGYEAMLAAAEDVERLPREQLTALRDLAARQHDQISAFHQQAAKYALAG